MSQVKPTEPRAVHVGRFRFSLRRLMIVVTALGLNFGVVPWPACAVIGAALTLPLFLSSVRLIEWVVIYGIAGVIAAVMMPPIEPHVGRARARIPAPPGAPPTAAVPTAARTGEDPVRSQTQDFSSRRP
jgi:hypothetical protein